MSYLSDSLSNGEQIVRRFPIHWVAWMRVWIMWGIFLAAPLGTYLATQDSRSAWMAVVLLPFALGPHLQLKFMEYGLTNRRVVFKRGIVARITEEMKISTIETVEIKQSVTGRLLGFGNVLTSGVGVSDVLFKQVANPMAVKKLIEEQRYLPAATI